MNNNQITNIANNELNMLLNHYDSNPSLFCNHLTNAYIYNQRKYPNNWKNINNSIFNMINNNKKLEEWTDSSVLDDFSEGDN